MTGEQSETWRIAGAVAWTASGNDIVALDLESPTAHPMTLQETAAYVWEELAESGPISTDALVKNIAEAYDATQDVVRNDVLELLERLHEQHLIIAG
ncbi:PqqD family protein [Microbacterium sp. 2MCAF23]|uniref:PqqD family protein n=1 Tax=Microbacterium sp. 2MCAF23 TaxID=3232985 RepID=UPI003F95646F